METGLIRQYKSISIDLLFEDNPIWVLAIDPHLINRLNSPQFSNHQELLDNISYSFKKLYSHILSSILVKLVTYKSSNIADLVLVSGSLPFCKSFSNTNVPTLAVVNSTFHIRCPSKNQIEFGSCNMILHQQV